VKNNRLLLSAALVILGVSFLTNVSLFAAGDNDKGVIVKQVAGTEKEKEIESKQALFARLKEFDVNKVETDRLYSGFRRLAEDGEAVPASAGAGAVLGFFAKKVPVKKAKDLTATTQLSNKNISNQVSFFQSFFGRSLRAGRFALAASVMTALVYRWDACLDIAFSFSSCFPQKVEPVVDSKKSAEQDSKDDKKL
jgi:hypothetical protein